MRDHLAIVTPAKLNDTVDASHQDKADGGGETTKEGIQAPSKVRSSAGSQVADHVITKGEQKDNDDDDLKDQTSHGYVNTQLAATLGIRHD